MSKMAFSHIIPNGMYFIRRAYEVKVSRVVATGGVEKRAVR